MDEKRMVRVSKFLSKHLRHAPDEIGLELEEGGWVNVDDLLDACGRHRFEITLDELIEVVERSDKKRFAFDPDETRIRANQGHSVDVDLQLEPVVPPEILFHGTPEKNVPSILETGLSKMARHHVHLSIDEPTARKVGARRGKPVILKIDSEAMHRDGFVFFCSANGVWLVDEVPARYIGV